ncbi:MAG: S8 family serine peptidase, partial [Candidatus Ranarchaeia archaeon]
MTKFVVRISSIIMGVLLLTTPVFATYTLYQQTLSSDILINSFSKQEILPQNMAFLHYKNVLTDQYILVGQVAENADQFYTSISEVISLMNGFERTAWGEILPFVIIDILDEPQDTHFTTLQNIPGVRTVIPNLNIMNLLGDVLEDQPIGDLPDLTMNLSRSLTDIDPLHNLGYKGAGVTIAIVDSGIDETHPDLSGTVVNRQSFVSTTYGWEDTETEDATRDYLGHGTGCAGVAAGRGNASNGAYTGMAPEADLVNVKVFDGWGRTTGAALFAGIDWALSLGVDIVSMSYGGGPPDPYAEDVLAETLLFQSALDDSVIMVASSGNEGPGYFSSGIPSAIPGVISVGAYNARDISGEADDQAGQLATYSSRGPTADWRVVPDVVAPSTVYAPIAEGSQIGTTIIELDRNLPGIGGDYWLFSGTSASAPTVA